MARNKDVAACFAARAAGKEAKAVKTRHMFIDGTAIYSYGRHFKIAEVKGGRVYVTMQRYSSSTSAHCGLVRSALRQAGVPFIEAEGL